MAVVRVVRWILIVFLVAFIAAQFVRPDRSNPATPESASLQARTPPDVHAILDRSCRDCHSNQTRWPWYTNVFPTSWLVASHVHDGREILNYSEWTSYPSDDQDKFLGAMCRLATKRAMPLPSYLLIHRDAKLSDADIKTLCAWSEKMRDTLE